MIVQDAIRALLPNYRHEGPTYATLSAAADRIVELEAEVRDLRASVAAIPDHQARIDELETALREIVLLWRDPPKTDAIGREGVRRLASAVGIASRALESSA
jgi:GTP1/Obg family GTP-binding protein